VDSSLEKSGSFHVLHHKAVSRSCANVAKNVSALVVTNSEK